jgi:hypothetical protein
MQVGELGLQRSEDALRDADDSEFVERAWTSSLADETRAR